MQVQAVNTQNNQTLTPTLSQRARGKDVSFGAIKYQDGLLNNKNRKAVSDFITRKLNEIDPSDKLKRTFVERADRWEHDILFTKGEKNNSVRIDVVSKLEQEETAAINNGVLIHNGTHVGTYSKPEQFDIQDFNKAYKPREKTDKFYVGFMYGLLGVLFTAAIGVVGYAVKKDVDSVNGKPNTTIVAKDSLKTDSIKPILEDSFKLGKKIIKK